MTILERIANFFKRKNKQQRVTVTNIDSDWCNSDVRIITPEYIYLNLPIFRSAIDYIAKTASQVPIYIYNGEKKIDIDFLKNPNKTQTWTQFIFESVAKKYIYGENVIKYDKQQLINLDSYEYDSITNNMARRIIPNPTARGESLSILDTCKALADRHLENLEATRNIIKNGGMSGILSLNIQNEFASAKLVENAENEVRKKFSGGSNYGKLAILGLPFSYSKISNNAQELGIIEYYKFDIIDVCRAFSIPSVLLNDNEQSTYNNIIEAEKRFYRTVIIPEIEDLCDTLTRLIRDALKLRGISNAYLWYSTAHIYALQDDITQVIDNELKLLNAGVVTADEVRKRLNR